MASSLSDMENLLAAAITAPSSHNTQPWKLRVKEDEIEVWGDEARMLPKSDANNRQFFISLGCLVENIVVVAEAEGREPSVSILPEHSQPLLAARVIFTQGKHMEAGEEILNVIRSRHANRDPYKLDPMPSELIEYIKRISTEDQRAILIEDDLRKNKIANIVKDATEAAFQDKGFTGELSRWIKPSLKHYRDGMPGYNIGVPWHLSFLVPLAIRYGNVAKQQRSMLDLPLAKTAAYIVIATKEDNSLSWIESGRMLERIWLEAAKIGLVMGPLAAAIQIGDFYKDIKGVLGSELRPQVFARLGYPTKIPRPSPRRSIDDILM